MPPSSYKNKNYILFLVSPNGLAAISFFIMLSVFLIPKRLYESIMLEPDYIFTTPFMPVFFTLCIISFLLGANSKIAIILQNNKAKSSHVIYNFKPMAYLFGLMLLISFYSFVSSLNKNNISEFFSNNTAEILKYNYNSEGTMSWVKQFLLFTTWWVLIRFLNYKKYLKGTMYYVIKCEIIAGILLYILLCIIRVARSELIPMLFGIAIIFGYYTSNKKNVSFLKTVFLVTFIFIMVCLVFFFFSFIRGSLGAIAFLTNILGYGPASFNHLCAVLNKTLYFPYAGNITYIFTFLYHIPLINHFVDFPDLFNMTNYNDVFKSEFFATYNVGLRGAYIWVTAFGYIYMNLGNFTYFYVYIMGLITGYSWQSFKYDNIAGVVTYPFFAGCILLWFGPNMFALPHFGVALEVVACLWFFEKMYTCSSQNKECEKAD